MSQKIKPLLGWVSSAGFCWEQLTLQQSLIAGAAAGFVLTAINANDKTNSVIKAVKVNFFIMPFLAKAKLQHEAAVYKPLVLINVKLCRW